MGTNERRWGRSSFATVPFGAPPPEYSTVENADLPHRGTRFSQGVNHSHLSWPSLLKKRGHFWEPDPGTFKGTFFASHQSFESTSSAAAAFSPEAGRVAAELDAKLKRILTEVVRLRQAGGAEGTARARRAQHLEPHTQQELHR